MELEELQNVEETQGRLFLGTKVISAPHMFDYDNINRLISSGHLSEEEVNRKWSEGIRWRVQNFAPEGSRFFYIGERKSIPIETEVKIQIQPVVYKREEWHGLPVSYFG